MPTKIQDKSKMNHYLKNLLILIAGVIAIFFLKELGNIFIPLFLAIFFAFLFGPLVSFLSRKKVPNFVILILLMIIVTVILFLIGTVVYASISSFANEFPKYQDKFIITFNNVLAQLKIPVEDAQYFFKDKVNWFELADRISLQKLITSTMGNFLDFIVSLILMILLLMFMVAERKNLNERMEAALLKYKSNIKPGIVKEIQKKIQTYVSRKTIISLGTAIFAMIISSFFKLDFIIIIGVITFILNYIPSIGSIIATIFPLSIYLLQYGFGGNFVFISVLLISSQFFFGNVLDPRYL
ncbi:MAG: AI-2E family transporter, partial [Candidatus Marinimicrobia bacterium]|nr:AI-2E family transporter [Candidatus Neomarinimicrobiota bacterium]